MASSQPLISAQIIPDKIPPSVAVDGLGKQSFDAYVRELDNSLKKQSVPLSLSSAEYSNGHHVTHAPTLSTQHACHAPYVSRKRKRVRVVLVRTFPPSNTCKFKAGSEEIREASKGRRASLEQI